jgi:plastocyanin
MSGIRALTRVIAPYGAVGLITLSGFLLPGRAASASADAASSYRVTMARYSYGPVSLTVREGDTVTWTNRDEAKHDVVTSGFRSPLLSKGQSWSHTFSSPGTFSYTCSIHPDMRAQVIVRAAAKPAPAEHTHTETSKESGHSRPRRSATPTTSSAGGSTASASPGPTAGDQQVTAPSASNTPTKAVNPLLLLAGLTCATTVFCLLLLTSPPSPPSPPAPQADRRED